jgi:hypothetical protein
MLGNTTCFIRGAGANPGGVLGGFENRISSGEVHDPTGASFGHVPLTFGGSGFRMVPQKNAPQSAEGELGDVRWVDDGKVSALYVKTARGWKRSKLV